jgi:hypothetical protein
MTNPVSTGPSIPIVVLDTGSPVQNAAELCAENTLLGDEPSKAVPSDIATSVGQLILNNLRAPAGNYEFAPRPDRVNQIATAANAQGIFPPDALVFVAK